MDTKAHSKMRAPLAYGEHKAYGRTKHNEIWGPEGKLAKREAFEAHSMRAEWESHWQGITYGGQLHVNEAHDAYVVYSYDQVIAIYDPVCFGPNGLTIDPNNLYGYSQATSKHINLCSAWLKG